MIHLNTTTEQDEDGYPVFVYEHGCNCHGCQTQRAQADSYRVEVIARVVRRLNDAATKLLAHKETELERIRAEDRFDILYEGMAEAFEKWEPVSPVGVH